MELLQQCMKYTVTCDWGFLGWHVVWRNCFRVLVLARFFSNKFKFDFASQLKEKWLQF